jgi:hypothetical protein
MSIIGGVNRRDIQRRKTSAHAFGKAKRALFLDELEASCNVQRASAAAGVNRSCAYVTRRKDPVFAEAWSQAIDAGCERLRAALLARALGTADQHPEDENPTKADRAFRETPPMSDETKLRVLQACRATIEGRHNNPHRRYPLGARSPEDALASLIAKLDKIEGGRNQDG